MNSSFLTQLIPQVCKRTRLVIFSSVLILTICALTACTPADEAGIEKDLSKTETDALPIQRIEGSYAHDVSDKRIAAGAADYVFVGRVLSEDGVVYEDPVPMEDEAGNLKEVGSPYTHYTVQVLENMKGTLRTQTPIEIVKDGGIAQDKKSVCLYEEDCLPQAGKDYIFLTYTQEDGSLLASGMNSSLPLETKFQDGKPAAEQPAPYREYKTAVKKQIVPKDCQRQRSIYEEKEGA